MNTTRQALWANIVSDVSVTPKALYHDSPIEWADHVITEYDKRFPEMDDRLKNERDNWEQTAARHLRNECYYRDIVVQIGEALGVEAKTCDDGSVVPDVLCAKVAELAIQKLSSQRDCILGLRAELIEVREAWNSDHLEMKRRLTVDPGKGYRILAVGEIIEDGDEYRSNVDDQWYPSCDAGDPVPGYRPYRRPVKPSTKPVATHRDLTVGETILDGDEYLGVSGHWLPTGCVGDRYDITPCSKGLSHHLPHRRPL